METLRSTFLPLDVKGGTRLFLNFDGDKYVVSTRFERLFRSKNLDKAIARFEAIVMGGAR